MLLIYTLVGIAFLILIYLYYRQVVAYKVQLDELRKEYLLPERWLLVAFMPFVGMLIYRQLKETLNDSFALLLSITREGKQKQLPFVYTKWVMFQERYDRKTSMYHGTDFRFLSLNTSYAFISVKNKPLSENAVFVDVARNPKDDLWARLQYMSPSWMLKNLKDDVVIPVIKDSDQKRIVDSCSPLGTRMLDGGESFAVGLSEYQIIKLPTLYLIWNDGDKQGYWALEQNILQWPPLKANNSDRNLYWKIDKNVLKLHQKVEFTRVISSLPFTLEAGQSQFLLPGDRFVIPEIGHTFLIAYNDNMGSV